MKQCAPKYLLVDNYCALFKDKGQHKFEALSFYKQMNFVLIIELSMKKVFFLLGKSCPLGSCL